MGLFCSNTNNSLNINAVSGTLTKTFDDSYFVLFQKGSKQEDAYFDDEIEPFRGRWNGHEWRDKVKIIVLQVQKELINW